MTKIYHTQSGIIGAQRIRKRKLLKTVARLLGIVFVFAMVHIATRVWVVETGYEIRRLMEQREELKGENHSLKVEVATLRSPVRLGRVAMQIGLKKPPEKQVLLMTYRTP
ncbi:MAG: cell division protein FtsL [Deltaproteobacteria bacterium]|nr:cell division protein FtsL [Deltaproteobacteria bacterium]